MKIHIRRNSRETWCGRKLKGLHITERPYEATCATCLKADLAEQQRNEREPSPRAVPIGR